jgi:hypothetical protein
MEIMSVILQYVLISLLMYSYILVAVAAYENLWSTNSIKTINVEDVRFVGRSVAISDNFAMVSSSVDQASPVWIYGKSNQFWDSEPAVTLTGNATKTDGFGKAIAMADNFCIVTAFLAKKAFIYAINSSSGTWGEKAVAVLDGYTHYSYFGSSVSMTNSYAIVGSSYGKVGANIAFIFARNLSTGIWETSAIATIDGYANDISFSGAIDMTDNFAIFGCQNTSRVYIFSRDTTTDVWKTSEPRIIQADEDYPLFGSAVSISDSYAVVAMRFNEGGNQVGKVAIYDLDELNEGEVVISMRGTSSKMYSIPNSNSYDGMFGSCVSTKGGTVLIGSGDGFSYGAHILPTYLATLDASGDWGELQQLHPLLSTDTVYGGFSVALSNRFAIVGKGGHLDSGASIYKRICPPGTSIENFDQSGVDCSMCKAGTFSAISNAPTCTNCTPGKYTRAAGMSACEDCPAGKWNNDAGKPSCVDCAAGKHSPTLGGSAESVCIVCAPGTFKYSAGSFSDCDLCELGTYIDVARSSKCIPCQVNTFADSLASSACKPCPEHTIASTIGSKQCSPAVMCPAGQYSESGYAPCNSCAAGQISSSPSASTNCVDCPNGHITKVAGEVVCVACGKGQFAKPGSYECKECSNEQVPTVDGGGCVACADDEYITGFQCVKQLSGGNAYEGVLANNGTPFYIMAILVVALGALGYAISVSKIHVPGLLQLQPREHIIQFAMNSAGLISELILSIAVMSSGNDTVVGYGVIMLLSRLLVAIAPGLMVFRVMFFGGDAIDKTGGKSLKYYMNGDIVVANSKLYTVALFLGLFDAPLLSFLPWYESEFSLASKFPTSKFMVTCYAFKLAQLILTLIAQIGIIVVSSRAGNTTDPVFTAIVVLNIVFSCFMVILRSMEMMLKWGLVNGSNKSEESGAANAACGNASAAANSVNANANEGGGNDIEMSSRGEVRLDDIYRHRESPSTILNPMLSGCATATTLASASASASVSAAEHESLLASFATQEQVKEMLLEQEARIEERILVRLKKETPAAEAGAAGGKSGSEI